MGILWHEECGRRSKWDNVLEIFRYLDIEIFRYSDITWYDMIEEDQSYVMHDLT